MLQKYFIALVPPEPLLSEIQRVKQQIFDDYGTKGALRSPGHITLHMPFSWEEEKKADRGALSIFIQQDFYHLPQKL